MSVSGGVVLQPTALSRLGSSLCRAHTHTHTETYTQRHTHSYTHAVPLRVLRDATTAETAAWRSFSGDTESVCEGGRDRESKCVCGGVPNVKKFGYKLFSSLSSNAANLELNFTI